MIAIIMIILFLIGIGSYLLTGVFIEPIWNCLGFSLIGWGIESAGVSIKKGLDDIAVGRLLKNSETKRNKNL